MSKSASELNLHQRINLIMSEASAVGKNATIKVGNFGYKAVTHDDVAALLHPLFVKHGITCVPTVKSCETVPLAGSKNNMTNIVVEITLYNIDDPEDFIEIQTAGDALDTQDKGVGKAYSYAVKYALLKLFMLESRDDEENRVSNGEAVNYASNSKPSDSQLNLIKKLITEKGFAIEGKIQTVISKLNKQTASKSIEMLMKGDVPKWVTNE